MANEMTELPFSLMPADAMVGRAAAEVSYAVQRVDGPGRDAAPSRGVAPGVEAPHQRPSDAEEHPEDQRHGQDQQLLAAGWHGEEAEEGEALPSVRLAIHERSKAPIEQWGEEGGRVACHFEIRCRRSLIDELINLTQNS